MRVFLISSMTLLFSIWSCKSNHYESEYRRLLQDINIFINKSDSVLSAAGSIGQYQSALAEIEQSIKLQFLPRVDSLMYKEKNMRRKTDLKMIKDFLILYSKIDRTALEETELRELRKSFDEVLKKERGNVK